MALRNLKKQLNQMEKADIIKVLAEMYKKVPEAKDYLDLVANEDIDKLISKYKDKIEKYVYPLSNGVMLNREALKLIKKVDKLKIPQMSAELGLFYVECCLVVISDFGFYDQTYYNSVYSTFAKATKSVSEMGGHELYHEQILDIMDVASELGIDLEY